MTFYNLKLVFRNLLKNKLYSFLSITGFAIGFSVCIAIAFYAYNEFTVDNCYPNYSRIYRLVNQKSKVCKIDYNLNSVLAESNPEIEVAIPFDVILGVDGTLKTDKKHTRISSLCIANNDFLKIFPLTVISGNPDRPFAGLETAIITKSLAIRLFDPDEDPIGRQINFENFIFATISAVVDNFPTNSSINGELLLNIDNENFRFSTSCETNDNCINPVNHYLLLSEKANVDELTRKLNINLETYNFAIDSILLQPLKDIYFDTSVKDSSNFKGSKNTLFVFIAIGVLIMLLSVVNYLNYNLSLQYSKLKEVGIKRVYGAGYRHLIWYYITEVSVGIIISIDIALVIIALLLPNINGLLGKHLDFSILQNPIMVALSISVVVVIILVNSIVPFYILSKFNLSNFFTDKGKGMGRMLGRNILTTFQFAVAIALLSCVVVIQKQLSFAQNADLGFEKENLVKIQLPFTFTQRDVLKHEISKLPFITGATYSHGTPGEINLWLGSSDSTQKSFYLAGITVDNDFFKTMELELVEGRWFLSGDVGKSCIMNQEAVKQFGWKSIDGKQYNNGRDGGYQVVGVVKNFHFDSHHNTITPACLLSSSPQQLDNLFNFSVRITPGDVNGKVKQIEDVWKRLIPDDPINLTFYDTLYNNMYLKERMLVAIIIIFTVIAIVLSCMGVLGQIFQTCINRTKEIGIRKVNGASTSSIIWLLNYDFFRLVFVAFALATPTSYWIMNKWLQSFAYKTPISWWVFAFSGLTVITISFITVTWQSWRTATQNPIEALRYE